ncbi:MAG: competence type IV pilus major pilin ComGC [Armatimonadota bacterium]
MRRTLAARDRRGFTLIEIMVTVLIIAVLLAIAIPNFITSRNSARTKTCMTNLSHILHAKEQIAAEEKLNNGDTVEWGDLTPDFLKVQPSCPADGDYTIGAIGETPRCSVDGHSLP